jgi:hypothetical protein
MIRMARFIPSRDAARKPNDGARNTFSTASVAATSTSLETRIRALEISVAKLAVDGLTESPCDCSAPKERDADQSIADLLIGVLGQLRRIADHFDPAPPDLIGSQYIAKRLGCTTVWITELVRNGSIPRSCVVPGTGNGKPWKFYRVQVDEWLKRR